MYAIEQNKEYSVLGKRIRRLGLHTLFDFLSCYFKQKLDIIFL